MTMIAIATAIAFVFVLACWVAAVAATVRYAAKVEPEKISVGVYITLFAVDLVLGAAMFFMWRL